MNGRRGFLAFVGGTVFTGPVTQQATISKPTLLLPSPQTLIEHAGHAAAGDHVTIWDADEATLIAWYRAASPAEKACVDRFVVRLSDGEVWASAMGHLLSDLVRDVPRYRTIRA